VTDDSKPKTLKDLQKEIPSADDVMRRLAMAQLASDYEAAMLPASLLEYMLMQAITTKFIPLGQEHIDSLFSDGGKGPICSFSAKIKIAYALGILSSETRSQIERIRIVRNHFAHHKDKSSFDDDAVKIECLKFKGHKGLKNLPEKFRKARESTITTKLRYVQVCFFVCSALSNYIIATGTLGDMRAPVDCF
jgi:DNA-binding MltR family transcriptional regulator